MRSRPLPVLPDPAPVGAVPSGLPQPGNLFPSFTSTDLHGREVTTREWLRGRSLLVVTTDREGSERSRAWLEAAVQRAPPALRLRSIVSLHLPFFVSVGMARGQARMQVPRAAWGDTLLDVRGQSAQALRLTTSREPYVFVIDADGRVVASVHGPVDAPRSRSIWEALGLGRELPAVQNDGGNPPAPGGR